MPWQRPTRKPMFHHDTQDAEGNLLIGLRSLFSQAWVANMTKEKQLQIVEHVLKEKGLATRVIP